VTVGSKTSVSRKTLSLFQTDGVTPAPVNRVPPGHGKLWNLGRPFSRPGKSWNIAKVMESHGK